MKEVHLLSGVVRNRKMATPHHRHSKIRDEGDDGGGQHGPRTFIARVWGYVPGNRILANIKIRAFKFEFKWDVFVFIMIAMLSLVPFFFHRVALGFGFAYVCLGHLPSSFRHWHFIWQYHFWGNG